LHKNYSPILLRDSQFDFKNNKNICENLTIEEEEDAKKVPFH
jgi:hypothetical protein